MTAKEKNGVLIAGCLGFLVVFGLIAWKKMNKEITAEADEYDVHQNLSVQDDEDQHGIEYLAMK